MNRRDLLSFLGVSPLLLMRAARGQEPGRAYRLGFLSPAPRSAPTTAALFDELRRSGFIEGQNLTVDPRGFEVRVEQLAPIAAGLVAVPVDVIVAGGAPAIHAAQRATATIPILGLTDDMVGQNLVKSMARPEANTTGISILATELDGKRQEILIEMMPGVRRMAALADPSTTAPDRLQALRETAARAGVEISIYQVIKEREIGGAIDAAKAGGAANVLASALFYAQRTPIIVQTAALGLPAIYHWPETAEEGGLAAYGPRLGQLFRDIYARQLVALLRAIKPSDLPVQQPTKFELVINLKTAKALGLTVPRSLLARADEVIE